MAAGATYDPIATTTLGSGANTITFSSIPSTYTDLKLVLVAIPSAADPYDIIFNGDTGTNYSYTRLFGDGASASSSTTTSVAYIRNNQSAYISTGVPFMISIDIFSYAGSTYKTMLSSLSSDLNGSGAVQRLAGLWRSTAAITSLTIGDSFNVMSVGTRATLYGIKAA
jgi:hypothetical protein